MANRIGELLKERNKTKYWLARQSGLSDHTIGRIVNDDKDIDILWYGTVLKVAQALEVQPEQLRK